MGRLPVIICGSLALLSAAVQFGDIDSDDPSDVTKHAVTKDNHAKVNSHGAKAGVSSAKHEVESKKANANARKESVSAAKDKSSKVEAAGKKGKKSSVPPVDADQKGAPAETQPADKQAPANQQGPIKRSKSKDITEILVTIDDLHDENSFCEVVQTGTCDEQDKCMAVCEDDAGQKKDILGNVIALTLEEDTISATIFDRVTQDVDFQNDIKQLWKRYEKNVSPDGLKKEKVFREEQIKASKKAIDFVLTQIENLDTKDQGAILLFMGMSNPPPLPDFDNGGIGRLLLDGEDWDPNKNRQNDEEPWKTLNLRLQAIKNPKGEIGGEATSLWGGAKGRDLRRTEQPQVKKINSEMEASHGIASCFQRVRQNMGVTTGAVGNDHGIAASVVPTLSKAYTKMFQGTGSLETADEIVKEYFHIENRAGSKDKGAYNQYIKPETFEILKAMNQDEDNREIAAQHLACASLSRNVEKNHAMNPDNEVSKQFQKCSVPWVGGASGSILEQIIFIQHFAPEVFTPKLVLSLMSALDLVGAHSLSEQVVVVQKFIELLKQRGSGNQDDVYFMDKVHAEAFEKFKTEWDVFNKIPRPFDLVSGCLAWTKEQMTEWGIPDEGLEDGTCKPAMSDEIWNKQSCRMKWFTKKLGEFVEATFTSAPGESEKSEEKIAPAAKKSQSEPDAKAPKEPETKAPTKPEAKAPTEPVKR